MKFFPSGLKSPVVIGRKESLSNLKNFTNASHSDSNSSSSSSQQVPSTPSSIPPTPTTHIYSSSSSSNLFQELPPELFRNIRPLLIILKAQKQKVYYNWTLEKNPDKSLQWEIRYANDTVEKLTSLSLIGPQMQLVTSNTKIEYVLPLINRNSSFSNFQISNDNLKFDEPNIVLSCNNTKQLDLLTSLCSLSIFENISVYKALTGTVISTMGFHLPDINMILNSQYNFKDWCEIYIQGKGWIKAWCHINRKSNINKSHSNNNNNESGSSSGGNKKNYKPKGKYQIKIYKDIKSNNPTSTANLICYIQDCDFVQDVFFYNQYPNFDDCEQFIQNFNSIRILGDVRYNNLDTILDDKKKKMFSPKRNVSTSSIKSDSSVNFDLKHNGIIIRPIAHKGLPHLDSMIKFIIPIFDVTRKYGRPNHFIVSRTDKDSLMFGLPKLPNTNYFKINDNAHLLSERNMIESDYDFNDPLTYSMSWVTEYLNKIYKSKTS
ncbi:Tph3p PWA37_000404 [Arxiozyma heterogenica]|uniref:Tph3p n=1 Tax=Arxiozyma heterogenica TaxID=278026 RepID=UPI002EE7A80A